MGCLFRTFKGIILLSILLLIGITALVILYRMHQPIPFPIQNFDKHYARLESERVEEMIQEAQIRGLTSPGRQFQLKITWDKLNGFFLTNLPRKDPWWRAVKLNFSYAGGEVSVWARIRIGPVNLQDPSKGGFRFDIFYKLGEVDTPEGQNVEIRSMRIGKQAMGGKMTAIIHYIMEWICGSRKMRIETWKRVGIPEIGKTTPVRTFLLPQGLKYEALYNDKRVL